MSGRKLLLPPLLLAGVAVAWICWATFHEPAGVGDTAEPPPSDATSPDDPFLPPVPPPGEDPDPPGAPTDPEPPGEGPEDGFLSVRGRVLYLDDEPAVDVGVGVVREWEGGSELYRVPEECTDPEGRFRLARIPIRGTRLAFFPILHDGASERDVTGLPAILSDPIEGEPGEEVPLGIFRLPPVGAIGGIVLDERGSPVSAAQVVAALPLAGLGRSATITDPDGRFLLEGLYPGRYFVHASHDFEGVGWRYKRLDDVTPGSTDLVLRLGGGSALLLRFRDSRRPTRALPLRSGSLRLVGSNAMRGFGGRRATKVRTEWRVYLTPGTYRLRFAAEGYRPTELGETVISADRETVVEVVLTPE